MPEVQPGNQTALRSRKHPSHVSLRRCTVKSTSGGLGVLDALDKAPNDYMDDYSLVSC